MTTFSSINELEEWLKESELDIKDVEVRRIIKEENELTSVTSDTITITSTDNANQTWVASDNISTSVSVPSVFSTEDIKVEVKSLSEQPAYKIMPLSEGADSDSENVWFVDDYESVEGACSTSKILYKGSTLLMNVCESEGVSKVSLILEIDGEIKRVPFKLEKACQSCEDHDMIISL
jgi:hypothetical protein